jgi:hypothetical protein
VPGASSGASRAGPAGPAAGGGRGSAADDVTSVRELLLNSPHDVAMLRERNPPLADALLSGSVG